MKSTTGTNCTPIGADGLARIGLSPFQLRGIRFVEGEEGAGGTDTGADTDTDQSLEDKGTSGDTDTDAETDTDTDGDKFDADKARDKIRKANSEAKNLRARAAQAEREAQENADASKKVPALEAELLKLRVAVKHGLPESLVKRLSGETEEELLQDAEELLEMFNKGGSRPPSGTPRENLRGGGNADVSTDPTADLDKFAQDAFRR